MGHKSTFNHCQAIIDNIESMTDEDWDDTTREERYWMGVAVELAEALAATTGYTRPGGP